MWLCESVFLFHPFGHIHYNIYQLYIKWIRECYFNVATLREGKGTAFGPNIFSMLFDVIWVEKCKVRQRRKSLLAVRKSSSLFSFLNWWLIFDWWTVKSLRETSCLLCAFIIIFWAMVSKMFCICLLLEMLCHHFLFWLSVAISIYVRTIRMIDWSTDNWMYVYVKWQTAQKWINHFK